MHEQSGGYTVSTAMELARGLKYGPLPTPSDPVPAPAEAITLIEAERHTCGFNWITGETAQAVLMAYLAGMQGDGVNPYADWSDEYRAWQEAKQTRKQSIEGDT